MNMKRFISMVLALMMVFVLTACDFRNDKQNGDYPNLSNWGNVKADEKDFTWDGDIITGLTTAGERKTTLIIPKRCKGFNGPLFLIGTEPIETVIFEGDHDVDIMGVFSFAENLRSVRLPANLTNIPKDAFYGCSSLQELKIPASVKTIGAGAFKFCTSLSSISLEGTAVTSIAEEAFEGCSALEEIVFTNSINEIGDEAFQNCFNLKSVTLPTDILIIGNYAFAANGLQDVYIPKGVRIENMGFAAFVQKNSVVTVHVAKNSWADEHFKELFDYSVKKVYD